MKKIKASLARRFPAAYPVLQQWYRLVSAEYRVLRQVGVRLLLARALRPQPKWHQVLPLQRVLRVHVPDVSWRSIDQLIDYLGERGVPFREGGHTVYVPPTSVRETVLAPLMDTYPANTGLKILRNPGMVA